MKKVILSFCFLFTITLAFSQDSKWPKMDASTLDAVYYPAEVAWRNYLSEDKRDLKPQMKLVYSRPMMKGRTIFGDLVPYGKEWRLGANEATQITFYQPVDINGTTVKSGVYTVFVTPAEGEWTFHFSSQSGIWGGANRDMSKDVASATVKTSMESNALEALTMTFREIDDQTVHLVAQWDKTRAALPIGLNPVLFDDVDKSPMDMVHYPSKSAYTNYLEGDEKNIKPKVQVTYSRPYKKDRNIFGELLKIGDTWRLGANEATEIVFYQDTDVNGTKVARGRYALFAKINNGSWDLIFSKDYPIWGAYNRDESMDKYTVNVKTSMDSEALENLSIIFEDKGENAADMIIGWDKTRATVPMKF